MKNNLECVALEKSSKESVSRQRDESIIFSRDGNYDRVDIEKDLLSLI